MHPCKFLGDHPVTISPVSQRSEDVNGNQAVQAKPKNICQVGILDKQV